ncbi:MAG: hypothetical protein JO218_16090 [Burkholderiales bacterium]|nr:hypothetical protein [Burkholderiales bacterium]
MAQDPKGIGHDELPATLLGRERNSPQHELGRAFFQLSLFIPSPLRCVSGFLLGVTAKFGKNGTLTKVFRIPGLKHGGVSMVMRYDQAASIC